MSAAKCKLFVLTLKRDAMIWFKAPSMNFPSSWSYIRSFRYLCAPFGIKPQVTMFCATFQAIWKFFETNHVMVSFNPTFSIFKPLPPLVEYFRCWFVLLHPLSRFAHKSICVIGTNVIYISFIADLMIISSYSLRNSVLFMRTQTVILMKVQTRGALVWLMPFHFNLLKDETKIILRRMI